MSVALAIGLPAVALIGLTSRRQSEWLFGASRMLHWRRLRPVGWLLLAASLVAVLSSGDRARGFILWVCGCGLFAAAVGATLSLCMALRKPSRR